MRTDRPDAAANWSRCRDLSGSTPGRENSVAVLTDLSLAGLEVRDTANGEVAIEVRVANLGFRPVESWRLSLWLDRNANARRDADEGLADVQGWPLDPEAEALLAFSVACPRTRTDLWAELTCPGDNDTINNRRRVGVAPGRSSRLLNLLITSFTPDGDGFEDSLPLVFRLPETGGRLSVAVYDLAGRAVRELYSGRPGRTDSLMSWDGLNRSGQRAASGIYCILLEYHLRGTILSEKQAAVLIRR